MLHTVNKSPFEKSALQSCIEHARAGDAILLIEDGVYGAVSGTAIADIIAARNGEVSLYALSPDLAARGLEKAKLIEGVLVVDYGGFVDLVTQHPVTQAWL
jgi:tRNA 2-thiouridine synthesizing protein B